MDAVDLVEKIKSDAPSFELNGVKYYIVENDLKVSEANLKTYAEGIISVYDPATPQPPGLERLVAATVDGKPIRWELPVELTWAIDEPSFDGEPDALAKAKVICAQATADWNSAAEERGIYDQVRFVEDTADPVFKFVYFRFSDPNLYAVAFFPNDPAVERVVNIGPTTFVEPNDFDAVGVIRHELGHVLGCRHEHIRPEAQEGMSRLQKLRMEQWVTGGVGAEVLTDYDSQSVMHYPLNGRGTLDFKLTEDDKAGFHKLYTLPPDDVKEFAI